MEYIYTNYLLIYTIEIYSVGLQHQCSILTTQSALKLVVRRIVERKNF